MEELSYNVLDGRFKQLQGKEEEPKVRGRGGRGRGFGFMVRVVVPSWEAEGTGLGTGLMFLPADRQRGPSCASMSFLCVCGCFAVLLAAAQTCQFEFLCGVESLQRVNLTDVKQLLSHGVALLLPLGGAGMFTQCWCADLSAPGPGLDRAYFL